MNKLLEISEFDTIVCENEKYGQRPGYVYLPEKTYRELESFVKECNSDDVFGETGDFFSIGFKKHIGDTITAKNYVGLIQLKSGYQIQVLPKIYLGDSAASTKQIFLKMLRTMKDFPGKSSGSANLRADRLNLYEFFIRMYLEDVRNLVKHGIKSAYVQKEDNLNVCKGKISFANQIKLNSVHRERFYCVFDEYQLNRPENKLIKSTLEKLQKITESNENAKEIRNLLTAFENVDSSINHDKDFASVIIDRNTQDYERLMKWSKVFLTNKSFSVFSGENEARALLFPMEKLFESYVYRELRKVVPDNWNITAQDSGYYLFNEPSNMFKLRPDIVIDVPDFGPIVLDTKWKHLNSDTRFNYGISQPDMYQMYAYSKKYQTSEIWLIYPINPEVDVDRDICFTSLEEQLTNVHVFFVDLANVEESLKLLVRKINSLSLKN